MLKIRLQRVARKHIPIFRVVLTDSRNSTKSGKAKEVLGTYNLITNEKQVDAERVKHWLSKGAQPSGTVHNFLVNGHIIEGKKINVLPKKRPIKSEEKPKEKRGEGGEAKTVVSSTETGEEVTDEKIGEATEMKETAETIREEIKNKEVEEVKTQD